MIIKVGGSNSEKPPVAEKYVKLSTFFIHPFCNHSGTKKALSPPPPSRPSPPQGFDISQSFPLQTYSASVEKRENKTCAFRFVKPYIIFYIQICKDLHHGYFLLTNILKTQLYKTEFFL